MLISRIKKRVSKFSEMVSQLNHFLLFSPFVCERATVMQNPSSVSLKFQCFSSSRVSHNVSLSESTHSSGSSCSLVANRVSRIVRTEAQEALFDYLHFTRNLNFTDAEHISKNSPSFVQSLLSEIDTEKDVARSLTRFFRYHPINEFEPFFESLGVRPSELPMLLPRHLMFLSDDSSMLENFRILCDYGIPRIKIGRMLKEAKEIFGYDFGVMYSKLQAYENLGLSRTTVIKLVSFCPSLLIGGVNSEFVELLRKLKGLGIENDWIGGYLTSNNTYNWKRMIDTMDFLEKLGYVEEEICGLFKTNPPMLLECSGKRVYALFGRLLKLGLKMNEVCILFKQNSKIFSRKCSRNLLRAVDFLLEIGMPTEDIGEIVANHMEFLGSSTLKGPKTVRRELKVRNDGLCQLIKEDPLKVLRLATKLKIKSSDQVACPNPSKHLDKASFLLGLGYVENSDEMTKASKKFRGRGDQLQERFDCLVQAGLDCNVVTDIIKRAPIILNQSKDVIEKKLDWLKNRLGYPLESLVSFPTYLCYDMDRINLRFSMYVWLRERGAAKPMLKLSTLLACSDSRFEKYFVDIHTEGPALWESLKASSASSFE
ncbi:Mitochodrial transcription termination factor [Trema orientale]|uniref:Mitochodrial transcription termination factor n=1 Tax=Trema orientale TaxID=63057 RepID=A0A2P5CLW9_TREOI|nr:Mitochodrial transcription termination factor [Trema orientale]